MKLLFAEDEVSMAEAVTDILTYHNYTVDTVYDGADALDYARAEQYDGIILDIMMPKKSGLEVLKTLRSELLSRVRAMLRRKDRFTPDIMTFGNVSLNLSSCELKGPLQSIVLPKIEYKLMELLMLNKGIYLSTEDILVKVWGYESDAESGAVWVYISYVRKRLAAIGADIEIRAKRSVGYTLAKIGDDD